jgi:hypothetical protein
MAVVGLPGAGSWPEGLVEILTHARRVFIGLDPDETGKRAATKLAEVGPRPGSSSCPTGEPKTDWNDYFLPAHPAATRTAGTPGATCSDLLTRPTWPASGCSPSPTCRTEVARAPRAAGIKLGWPSIDAVIRPGLKPGQVMIPLAKTGTGKSAWLSNIAHNTRSTGSCTAPGADRRRGLRAPAAHPPVLEPRATRALMLADYPPADHRDEPDRQGRPHGAGR